jgi:hypothetical protein
VQIDRFALLIRPARIAPAGPHDNDLPVRKRVTAGVQHGRDAIGLQVGTIADMDLSRHDGDPVHLLAAGSSPGQAAVLVGQLEVSEALCGQVEGRVDAPEFVGFLGFRAGFRHRRGVDQADQPPARRRLQDGRVGNIGEAGGRSPGRGRA